MNYGCLLFVSLALAACTPWQPVESVQEITGIEAISKLLAKHSQLPSPLIDANFIEEWTGDGRMGSSDFHSFYALSVASEDLQAWRSTLQPLEPQNSPPKYAVPKTSASWWLTSSEFRDLEFYSPKLVTGRMNGWVGVNPQSGRIYIYAFTM